MRVFKDVEEKSKQVKHSREGEHNRIMEERLHKCWRDAAKKGKIGKTRAKKIMRRRPRGRGGSEGGSEEGGRRRKEEAKGRKRKRKRRIRKEEEE